MTCRMSRRTAAKLFLSASAVLALPRSVSAQPGTKKTATPALTPSERQKLAKSVAQLRAATDKVRGMQIPIGTEPAFVFRPLSARR